ncbi:hypothetical protein HWQ46_16975 [Shewanella sp. D64]|uniref:hypothetical protein n=1 Tax=unclassified Shewanella TaxID=196818 RepID=UPI0022BA6E36|nr:MULTISPECIES: hypothetical protein [unclassified Shewanella]MEC4727241.1 hypothetical protein [Shewanella sp. D64]MEC4739396.1 hypothetical protein [Shewanella sp. E94]WBJ96725.1 hypothetical protein HWQ47_06310 [Shewanella sp. MTB7]
MITFVIDMPFLTKKQYAEKVDKSEASVQGDIDKGYLPTYQPVAGGKHYINMIGLAKMADELYEHQKKTAPWAVNTGIR